jgi:hypothetical protein
MSELLTFKTINDKSKLLQQFNLMKTSSKDPDFHKIKITTQHNDIVLDITQDLHKSFPYPSLEVSSPAGKAKLPTANQLE